MADMGVFTSLEISASGLAAQRLRMNVIANNIANASTTRTPEGGPYRRQVVDFRAALEGPQILVPAGPAPGMHLAEPHAEGAPPSAPQVAAERFAVLPAGVEVARVSEDSSELPMVYDPSHPDADAKGYVRMPNVNPVAEMMDLMTASRAYEANVTAIGVARDMANNTLQIGR
ncbi:MAG TPA: flagellar basal body rod protein FlgC [Candidatus Saccharimonadales bacterium]|nr:flagellar basal body rod protein FlgC [Candidatus Saccharimonadales bacterium]